MSQFFTTKRDDGTPITVEYEIIAKARDKALLIEIMDTDTSATIDPDYMTNSEKRRIEAEARKHDQATERETA